MVCRPYELFFCFMPTSQHTRSLFTAAGLSPPSLHATRCSTQSKRLTIRRLRIILERNSNNLSGSVQNSCVRELAMRASALPPATAAHPARLPLFVNSSSPCLAGGTCDGAEDAAWAGLTSSLAPRAGAAIMTPRTGALTAPSLHMKGPSGKLWRAPLSPYQPRARTPRRQLLCFTYTVPFLRLSGTLLLRAQHLFRHTFRNICQGARGSYKRLFRGTACAWTLHLQDPIPSTVALPHLSTSHQAITLPISQDCLSVCATGPRLPCCRLLRSSSAWTSLA